MNSFVPATVALASALLLGGCSAVPTGAPPADESSSEGSPAEGGGSGQLCDVASAEELAEIFGQPVGPAEPVTNISVTESGFQVVSPSCSWVLEDVIEIKVVYTQGTSFESGTLECDEPEPIFGPPTAVDGLAERAWWSFDDTFDAEGTMWACTTDAMIELRIERPEGDSAAMQAQATAVIEKVLALL